LRRRLTSRSDVKAHSAGRSHKAVWLRAAAGLQARRAHSAPWDLRRRLTSRSDVKARSAGRSHKAVWLRAAAGL
jgi:hypothetical protein